jgi:hypothetical protein
LSGTYLKQRQAMRHEGAGTYWAAALFGAIHAPLRTRLLQVIFWCGARLLAARRRALEVRWPEGGVVQELAMAVVQVGSEALEPD